MKLSSEQKNQVENLDRTFELDTGKACKELHNKRKALNAALLKTQTDKKEIDSIISEISRLQGVLEKRVVLHLLKVKQVFTPVQQKKFFSMIEEEMCKCEEHHGGMK